MKRIDCLIDLGHVLIADDSSHVKVSFYVLNLKTTQRRKTDDTNWAFIIILYYFIIIILYYFII